MPNTSGKSPKEDLVTILQTLSGEFLLGDVRDRQTCEPNVLTREVIPWLGTIIPIPEATAHLAESAPKSIWIGRSESTPSDIAVLRRSNQPGVLTFGTDASASVLVPS